jgi:hypothetical protein
MRRMTWRRAGRAAAVILIASAGLYYAAAYIVLPRLWSHYEHEPGLAGRPMVTVTADGIPGDPLNVGLVGSREEAIRALAAAGWYPADAVTLRTSIEIAGSVLFDRPYRDAPVSPLFYDGRKQDFAFERPAGNSADRRNHVRFWQVLERGKGGRPVWLGSATFDRGAGISHYTGEITHHIDADIDAERDRLIADLSGAGMLTRIFQVTGIGPTLFGRNGGGDRYFTDGEITIGVLTADAAKTSKRPVVAENPAAVGLKNAVWQWARGRPIAAGSALP